MSIFSQNNSTKFYWPTGDVDKLLDVANGLCPPSVFQVDLPVMPTIKPNIPITGE